MITRSNSVQTSARSILVDFDQYTDGDPEFKKELVESMIDNLVEIQEVAVLASRDNDAGLFQRICHKIKPTIQMLEDKDLSEIVRLKIDITDQGSSDRLSKVCVEIIGLLRQAVA